MPPHSPLVAPGTGCGGERIHAMARAHLAFLVHHSLLQDVRRRKRVVSRNRLNAKTTISLSFPDRIC